MKIVVIGLGYVGLPLGVLLAKKYNVIGFDIDKKRISELGQFNDKTNEVEASDLKSVTKQSNNASLGIFFTNKIDDIRKADIYIVTVPTPVDKFNKPDFTPLIKASETVGKVIDKGAIVIFESTVYPGATEEICVPVIEKNSALRFNKDFFAGYSPERINPGDKVNTLENIVKITSGSTPETALKIDNLYKSIISAGTFPVSSIKVAEASKVIENAQRDINIAFVNELAKIFNLLAIDTNEVLDAASTKWNFINFRPGMVGGHCIGVDPYYLAHKAQELGYHPEIILSGRRMNDSMSSYIAYEVVKIALEKKIKVKNARVLLLGITFKENCNDIRNTKVIDLYKSLVEFGFIVDVYDPIADKIEVKKTLHINLLKQIPKNQKYHVAILAVKHDEFNTFDPVLYVKKKSVIYDVKSYLTCDVDGKL
ncbi:UDP-N-acetyl-D-galactosamine dehydrogenase [Flavobacterium fontis]|uniref:UDP-N-acetyl-D-galactosamine dehydrogenase n=1 Tax=Flavobacterium fontis TaxID=1124188 RepID=A0A1M4WPX4_9FLAO|nr:nucleotide sugar dehydrogenase [Flavobacterium fontis]SHE83275.1 UDP-N-acetyl-D-galactosamine dehydrogenase [Flavobacterium fontis]